MVKLKKQLGKKFLFLVLVLIGFSQIFPLYWLLTFSLKDNVEIFGANIIGLPKIWRFENYSVALTDGGILGYFLNSVLYSAVTVIVAGTVSAMAAYAITRMKWKFSNFVFMLFTLGIMIPVQAALLPLFQVLDFLGLKGGYLGLMIPYVAFAIPMSIMILSSFYKSLPKEMEEAAFIDGCGIFRTFFLIILPLIKPALATSTIFAFLGTWNELLFANTFVDSKAYKTLPVGIMSFTGQYSTDWGLIGAGMVIATLPTILIYLILSNQVKDSIVAGAVKG